MGLKDSQIELDSPDNTYYAGQTVNGKVTFTFDLPVKIQGIVIKFFGEAETKWTDGGMKVEQEGMQDESTVKLIGQEDYLRVQYYLLGGQNCKQIDLDVGTHSYPFTCVLPPNLPSSFEGKWGFVRYTIKVTLERSCKFDPDIEKAFTVITPVDLNSNLRLQQPFKLELESTFCCLWCASGPLSVIVHVPVTGFVPGQTIPLTIECDNASDVEVESVKLFLRKLLTFHVRTPHRDTKKKKEVISETSVGPVEGGKSRTWNHSITVPLQTPPNLVNCGIIDIDYDIKVEVTVIGPHFPLDGNIPVALGTVPLNSSLPPPPYRDNPPLVDSLILSTQPVSPANSPNSMPLPGWNIPDIGPPTFEEATFQTPSFSNRNDSELKRFVGPAEYAALCYPTTVFTPSKAPSAPPENF